MTNKATTMFLDCPAYLNQDGSARCGLSAEVRCWYTMGSTGGPPESATIKCPVGHWFNGPIEFPTWQSSQQQHRNTATTAFSAKRDSLTGGHDGPDTSSKFTVRAAPGEPEPQSPRLNSAPAYYLGRPAHPWITAMRPRHRRTASHHLIEAVTGS